MLESEVCSLRTDFSHLTSTVENMKAEIVELQKSKLSSSVELTEPRDSNVQHENATASTCDQYDDESILLRCKDIHDILAYFPEMELIREDLTIICKKQRFNNNSKKHDDTFLSYWKCFTCQGVFG